MYPSLSASDPLSALIESERDIGGVKLFIAHTFPGTMRATEYRMCISASKKSAIRRKRKKVLSYTSRPTGCHNPRPIRPRLASTAASCRVPADAAHPATTTAVSRLNRTDLILHIVFLLQCGRPNPARPLLPSRRSSCLLTIKG